MGIVDILRVSGYYFFEKVDAATINHCWLMVKLAAE